MTRTTGVPCGSRLLKPLVRSPAHSDTTSRPAGSSAPKSRTTLNASAGFTAITLDYRVEWDVPAPPPADWEARLHTAPNPLAPTYAEAMASTLTPAERDRLIAALRDQVAAGAPATHTMATAYLRAVHP